MCSCLPCLLLGYNRGSVVDESLPSVAVSFSMVHALPVLASRSELWSQRLAGVSVRAKRDCREVLWGPVAGAPEFC